MESAPLDAATIYAILETLRSMLEPARWIPEAFSMLIETMISMDLLNAFLLEDELNNEESKSLEHSSNIRVEIKGNFSWELESAVPTLREISLEVKTRQKIEVCGQVGAGKSTLMCAILREVYKISGSVSVNGTIAYVSQAPWIQSGTIRDNILSEKLMEKVKYEMEINDNQSELPSESCSTREGGENEISVEGFPNTQLTLKEERKIGDVGCKPMLDYLYVSKGSLLFILSLLSYCAFSALQNAALYWLSLALWSSKVNNAMLIGVYARISTISIPFLYLSNLFATLLGLKASKAFFSGLNNSIFKAPMLFFDSTPVGRIFARISSDMNTLDNDLPTSINLAAAATIDVLVTIALMASITWTVLIVIIPTIIIAKYIQDYSSEKEFVRMNGMTTAPILNNLSETSQGVVLIRAFNKMESFFENYLKLVDTDARLFFHSNAAMEWLVLRIEALQILVILTATLLVVLLPGQRLPSNYYNP
ncbi:hypothetical protein LWI28_005228 [Acer negundo]|uniref:ABC transmembrane type-1 domain-containing protein n=1 Tax=Acer negundo TaxID=4023 RepID=A0AAD5ISL4_ACENE|nr:hypothetical protein LWI28_005228 [Acer negundo]